MTTTQFTPDNCAVLLIDHQDGTMSWVRSMPVDDMKKNVLALARAAKALGIPLVLTSSLEDQAQGALMSDLKDIAPEEYAGRVRRKGVVDAFDDAAYVAAVRATGRRNLIVAGVTNDVCTVFPTMTAREQGFEVRVVADAGGSMSNAADDLAIARMKASGAVIVSANMMLTELARDWSSDAGAKLVPIVGELVPQ